MIWADIDTWAGLLAWLRSQPYAVLCGSGISRRSGLPTGQAFNTTFLREVVEPDSSTTIEKHLHYDSPVPLRFEGILDVWWRICDPQLGVLDTYRFGTPTSEHCALAHLARSHAVVTTNFDGLIERAWAGPGELDVAYTDDHFKAPPRDSGLYKIHGTLQRFTKGRVEELTERDEGFPIVTLRAISGNMESVPRREYLHQLRETRPLLVVGYSGMDDFDVCRWLFEPRSPREGVWIDYDETTKTTRVLSGRQAVGARAAPRPIRRATEEYVLDAWKVVLTDNPALLLKDLSGQPFEIAHHSALPLNWGSPSDWQRLIVTAMLLLQLSRFSDAEALLRSVLDTKALSPDERLRTKMCLAQVLIPTGDPRKREDALAHATGIADSPLVDVPLRQRTAFLATQAKFFTHHLSAQELGNALDTLYRQANSRGDAELAVDIAVFGGQQARTHPTMKAAFNAALAGGSLPAKGVVLHEAARSKWSGCDSPEGLRETIGAMEQAIAFRRDLGQLDGTCASLNVCGVMHQRLAEWTSPVAPDYDSAAERHMESLQLATDAGLVWHRSQALINLAYIDAKRENPKELGDRIAKIRWLGDVLDDSDWHRISFLTAHARVLAGDFPGAAQEYEALVALPESAKLGNRMKGAAEFNARLCRTWLACGTPLPAELPLSHKGIAFWEHRFGCLHKLAKASALIDPLPPSN